VWVRRDDAGVPHIFAEDYADLGFGVGVAMAQDRLWQMETLRRLASGRLAELAGDPRIEGPSLHLIGPSLLAVDQLYRSLGMQRLGREELALASDDGRDLLDGFARGVNAWVARSGTDELPLEFTLAGIKPEPWRAEDCLTIGKLIAWFLSLAFLAKPSLAALAADPARVSLLPPHLTDGHCITDGHRLPDATRLDLLARHALGLLGPGTGSNSWVVGGDRTASGKPLLCNDPHLLFGLPALWYPLALTTPGYRVIGAAMAGIPGVLIGRNDHLAWGMTAVMADDGDFYRETLDPSGAHYRRDGAWLPIETVDEVFHVRGRREPVRGALRYVRHEGVLCPLVSTDPAEPPTSFRWVGLEAWGGLDALLGMNRAGSMAEFEDALRGFAGPAQNVVVADRQGDFAYFCAGKFPRRAGISQRAPLLDGATPEHSWGGYLPWSEQPRMMNPREGFIVTANNRVAAEMPPALAGGFWEPPYRATRIASLLNGMERARIQDMAEIQADVFSVQAAGILASVVRPARSSLRDPRATAAADLLLAWDCHMAADSPGAALYQLFYQQLLQQCVRPVLERETPGLFARYLSTLHVAVGAIDRALLSGDRLLFPDGLTGAVEACLLAAWEAARARLGPAPTAWRWGDLHRVTFRHSLGRGDGLASRVLVWLFRLNRGPYPRSGDGMTVSLAAFLLTRPFDVAVGPAYRQLIDLGAPEESRWIIAGGVSGDPRSRHYDDQLALWLVAETRPMRFLARGEPDSQVLRLGPTEAVQAAADCASSPRVL
jgi:penicillin amidase